MSTQAITNPVRAQRRPGTLVWAAVALVVAAGVGAGVVALTSTGTSERLEAPTAALAPSPIDVCDGDGGALLAIVASMPVEVSERVTSGLSPETRAGLRSAAVESAITGGSLPTPDTATLAGVLHRVGPADAAVVMSGLSPETRAVIDTTPAGPACP